MNKFVSRDGVNEFEEVGTLRFAANPFHLCWLLSC